MRALAKEDLATPTHYVMCYINPKLTRKSTAFCESKTEEMADFKGGRLLAVIGDEDTCTGFLLGGVGEMNAKREPNFLVVDKDTPVSDIEDSFKSFSTRTDIAVILINQNVAETIRHLLDEYDKATPAILEIPSKDHPYDPTKDGILRRAKGMFNADDFR